MFLLAKICLGLFLLAGLGTAIGLPLSYSAIKSSTISKVSARGGQTDNSLTLAECGGRSSLGSSSSFGESERGVYCWKLKDGDQPGSPIRSELTSLLQKMWGRSRGEGYWMLKSGPTWLNSCTKGSESWVMSVSSGGGSEHLGYCDNSADSKEASFLNINKSGDSKVNSFKFCEKDCWLDSIPNPPQKVQVLTNKDEKNWIELEFYKN